MSGKVVVITGASSGIGRITALRFAEAGADVVLAARRKRLLKELAHECEQHNVRALAIETDVSDEDDVSELAHQAERKLGRIDVWVNNAGVGAFGRFEDIPLEEHRKLIDTNLMGTIYGCYEAIRYFRKQGHGIIINVSSLAGRGSAPYHSSYVASKHGTRGLGMALRQELFANNERDINVCTVMPASIDTPFFQHASNHLGKPIKPIPPTYTPEEVADTIYNLALNPKPEEMVGRSGKFIGVQGKFAPILTEKAMAMNTHRRLMGQDKHVPDSTGSLFKPMQEGSGIRGGWLDGGAERTTKNSTSATKLAGTIAAFAVPALMAFMMMTRQEKPAPTHVA